jgi:proton glutamate symport protein
MLNFFEGLSETMFKFTNIVMFLAPIAIGAALAYTVGTTGFGVLLSLAKLVTTLYVSLIVFVLCVLVPIAIVFRLPLKKLCGAIAGPAAIAFATSSSEAALPRAMEAMEGFGVPREIVAVVIPAGYSFNLDGSTLYLAVAAVFVMHAGGLHFRLGQQISMMLLMMLASKGVAGVSRGALVVLMGIAAQLGLPVAPIFILLGIDQLMDMGRTSLNVIGNCLATAVIAKWERNLASRE